MHHGAFDALLPKRGEREVGSSDRSFLQAFGEVVEVVSGFFWGVYGGISLFACLFVHVFFFGGGVVL